MVSPSIIDSILIGAVEAAGRTSKLSKVHSPINATLFRMGAIIYHLGLGFNSVVIMLRNLRKIYRIEVDLSIFIKKARVTRSERKHMVTPNLLLVRDKVQRFSKQFFNVVQLDDDGDLSIPYESTHLYISCSELDQSSPELNEFRRENEISTTLVNIWALVLREVKGTPELFKWIATEGQTFYYGRFAARELPDAPGKYVLIFEYNLAGDNLDPGELKGALASIGFTADNEDDALKARFGGKTVEDLRQE